MYTQVYKIITRRALSILRVFTVVGCHRTSEVNKACRNTHRFDIYTHKLVLYRFGFELCNLCVYNTKSERRNIYCTAVCTRIS